jgi:hypothetical protein
LGKENSLNGRILMKLCGIIEKKSIDVPVIRGASGGFEGEREKY